MLMLGGVFVVFDKSAFESFDLPKRVYLGLSVLLLSLLILGISFGKRFQLGSYFPSAIVAVLLPTTAILFAYSFLNNDWRTILPSFLRVMLYFASGLLFLLCHPRNAKEFNTLCWILLLLAASQAVLAIFQYAGADPFFGRATSAFVGEQKFRRMVGLTGYSNYLAGLIAAIIPFGICLIVQQRRLCLKAIVSTLLLLMLITLAMTKGRAATLAGLIGTGLMGFLVWRNRRVSGVQEQRTCFWRLAVFMGVLVATIALFFGLWISGAASRWKQAFTTREFAVAQRLRIWRNTIRLIGERPLLGYGAGSFGFWYPRSTIDISELLGDDQEARRVLSEVKAQETRGLLSGFLRISPGDPAPSVSPSEEWILETHNEYLQSVFEFGAVPFAILIAFTAVFARRYVRAVRKEVRSAERSPLAAYRWAIMASIVAFGVDAFLGFPLRVLPNGLLGVALLALLVGDYARLREKRIAFKNQRVVLGAIAIGILPIVWCQVCELRSSRVFVAEMNQPVSSTSEGRLTGRPFRKAYCPWDGARLAYRGAALLSAGNNRMANGLLHEVVKFHSDPNLFMNAGRAALLSGDFDAAEHGYNLAVQSGFRLTENLVNLAVAYKHQGEFDEALKLLEIARRLSPKDDRVNLETGRTLLVTDNPARAEESLRQVSPRSDGPELRVFLVTSLWLQGEIEDAKALLGQSLQNYPDSREIAELKAKLFPDRTGPAH
jgi:O-antigen ligase